MGARARALVLATLLVAACGGRSSKETGTGGAGGATSAGGASADAGAVGGRTAGVGGTSAATGGAGGARAGTGGTGGCPMIWDCFNCLPRLDGCPTGICPASCHAGGKGATESSAAGETNEAGASAGETGAGPVDDTPLSNDDLVRGCELYCTDAIAACGIDENYFCEQHCEVGYANLPARCASSYLVFAACAGKLDDCAEQLHAPAGCTGEEAALVACVYREPPEGCSWVETTAGFEGCRRVIQCPTQRYWIECAPSDGPYNEGPYVDCQCGSDIGPFSAGNFMTRGAVACAERAPHCDPLIFPR